MNERTRNRLRQLTSPDGLLSEITRPLSTPEHMRTWGSERPDQDLPEVPSQLRPGDISAFHRHLQELRSAGQLVYTATLHGGRGLSEALAEAYRSLGLFLAIPGWHETKLVAQERANAVRACTEAASRLQGARVVRPQTTETAEGLLKDLRDPVEPPRRPADAGHPAFWATAITARLSGIVYRGYIVANTPAAGDSNVAAAAAVDRATEGLVQAFRVALGL